MDSLFNAALNTSHVCRNPYLALDTQHHFLELQLSKIKNATRTNQFALQNKKRTRNEPIRQYSISLLRKWIQKFILTRWHRRWSWSNLVNYNIIQLSRQALHDAPSVLLVFLRLFQSYYLPYVANYTVMKFTLSFSFVELALCENGESKSIYQIIAPPRAHWSIIDCLLNRSVLHTLLSSTLKCSQLSVRTSLSIFKAFYSILKNVWRAEV